MAELGVPDVGWQFGDVVTNGKMKLIVLGERLPDPLKAHPLVGRVGYSFWGLHLGAACDVCGPTGAHKGRTPNWRKVDEKPHVSS